MGDYHSVQLDIQNIETIFYHLSERPDACSNPFQHTTFPITSLPISIILKKEKKVLGINPVVTPLTTS